MGNNNGKCECNELDKTIKTNLNKINTLATKQNDLNITVNKYEKEVVNCKRKKQKEKEELQQTKLNFKATLKSLTSPGVKTRLKTRKSMPEIKYTNWFDNVLHKIL